MLFEGRFQVESNRIELHSTSILCSPSAKSVKQLVRTMELTSKGDLV